MSLQTITVEQEMKASFGTLDTDATPLRKTSD